jgi:AcrR family transcriptional regulator
VGRPPQRRANRATIAEQQIQCYRLRLTGMTVRDIAAKVGLSVGTVHNRIHSEINDRVTPLADELLAIELDRLDRWLVRLDAQIESGFAVARNVEVAIRVSERRSRLLGLDSPVRSRVEVITLDVLDEEIAKLEAELAVRGNEGDAE